VGYHLVRLLFFKTQFLYQDCCQIQFSISKSVIWFFFIACTISCQSRLEQKDYIAWVRDYENGLHVKKSNAEFTFDLQYQPSAYVWLQRHGAGTEKIDTTEIATIAGTQYYILTIAVERNDVDFIDYNVKDIKEKQQKLYYFSYQFQNDIFLEENNTRLPCVLFHFERSIDLNQNCTFILGFENQNSDSKEAKLIIQSQQFGSLPVKIKVSKTNIPSLAI
jgi:hypothetical protein